MVECFGCAEPYDEADERASPVHCPSCNARVIRERAASHDPPTLRPRSPHGDEHAHTDRRPAAPAGPGRAP